jgi:hypothetical protein
LFTDIDIANNASTLVDILISSVELFSYYPFLEFILKCQPYRPSAQPGERLPLDGGLW